MDGYICEHCKGEFGGESAIKQGDMQFCCAGCAGVWGFLNDNKLSEFYDRLGKSDHFKPINNPLSGDGDSKNIIENFYKNYVKRLQNGVCEIYIIIEGIHCSACVWLNEKVLARLDGVLGVVINSANNKAKITWDDSAISLGEILKTIQAIGYNPLPYDPARSEVKSSAARRDFYAKMLVGVFCTMNIMWVAVALWGGYFSGMDSKIKDILHFAEFILASPVLFYTGSAFFKNGFNALKNGHATMDLSVAVGASIAYFYSVFVMLNRSGEVYFDSVAMIITFVFIGKFLEVISKKRCFDSLDGITQMIVKEVFAKSGNGDFTMRSINEIAIDDEIMLRMGERAMIDGGVISGVASADSSMITGESAPVLLKNGSQITSGMICLEGSVIYKASASFSDSTLNKIAQILEGAAFKRPHIEELANKIAAKFSLIILALGMITFALWGYFSGVAVALPIAISVIIIACPCALSLATPVAALMGLGVGLKRGALFKEARILERLAKCKTVVFDKTGTISKAHLKVVKSSGEINGENRAILASLAAASAHPVSVAVREFINENSLLELTDIQNHIGKGICAKIGDLNIAAGSFELMKSIGAAPANNSASTNDLANYYFAINRQIIAQFWCEDELKNESKEAVKALKSFGLNVVMLTGDSEIVAQKVAEYLGIDKVVARADPLKKADFIKELGEGVLMVGDGINDAVAMQSSSVAIAMGSGAAISIDRSDVVVLNGDLNAVAAAVEVSQKTLKTIKQNLIFSLAYNAITIPLAIAGFIIPLFAAISMSLSSLIVVLNSARLNSVATLKGFK